MSASPACPRCGGELAPLGAGRVCRSCRGAWISEDRLAEMVRTMHDEVFTDDVELPPRAADEAALLCPACGIALEPRVFATQKVDRCAAGHGVWLDGGELAASLRAAARDS
jgi:Zn-finger nucleic acid-binding protein